MTEGKSCSRCGECCKVLPLFTQHMHPDFRKYLLNRGLKEDKEQGCILIPHVCQHLHGESKVVGFDEDTGNTFDESFYTCAIHDSPERPDICRKYHGQRMMKNARIYIPPECSYRREP